MALLVILRKRIREFRRQYGSVYRDIIRIITISVTHSQIGTSVVSIPGIRWPPTYEAFINNLSSIVNVDLPAILGLKCIKGFDLPLSIAFSCLLVVAIFLRPVLYHVQGHRPITDNRKDIAAELFDSGVGRIKTLFGEARLVVAMWRSWKL